MWREAGVSKCQVLHTDWINSKALLGRTEPAVYAVMRPVTSYDRPSWKVRFKNGCMISTITLCAALMNTAL